jgi:outer membrane autotransporter protein
MKRSILTLSIVAAAATWSSASMAQRQTAVGPSQNIPLSPTGSLNGVDMSASATTGTLVVGVVGGPQADIFSLNNPPLPGTVAVSTAASSQGNIVFNSSSNVYGAVGATQPAGPFLLGISGGNAGTTVNFQGPVFATTLNVLGTGNVDFNSGSTNVTATNFAGDGTISLAPNTIVIGALTTTAGANTGTLSLGNASVLDGAVGGAIGLRAINVVGGSSAAGATATITGAANAYTFNLGTNTLNVGGALTIANGGPSGVINTTLASSTVYGNIRPVGATNLGATLLVNVTVPATAYIPVNTQFNIVQTRAGTVQSGTDGTVVVVVKDPTNPLYTFAAVPLAGTVAGLVAIRTTSIPILVPLAPPPGVTLPPTAAVAALVVPALLASSSPDVANVLASLNSISDPTLVVNALAQLAPSSSDLAAPLVTFQAVGQFQGLLMSHLDDSLCREVSALEQNPASCNGEDQRGGWWTKGFGYAGSQGSQGSFAGYDSVIAGGMVGYDVQVGNGTRVGISVGYARSTITGKPFDTETDGNSYQATAYVNHEVGPWFVNGDLSLGWNEYTGRRNIAFPGVDRTATAGYNGQDYTAFATTGYHFKADKFTVTPFVSLQYTHVHTGSYTESGAGDIDLSVAGRGDDFLESGMGVKIARAFRGTDSAVTYVPEIHAEWLHELSNPTMSQTASFTAAGSPSLTTSGLRMGADTLNLGAGLTLLTCSCSTKAWSLEAVYDYYRRSDNYTANQGSLKFTRRF